ncbi:MAG TPA: helix-turn-helix domain-containing protein [Usitatibacter sp.]|nr:helix-turn-helix domain-containing protein [Usitatibacter sp.]
MKEGPNIVKIAALLGDRARSEMLTALLGGQALTATELAEHADVAKQTASGHLALLVEAKLLAVEKQGRHRYFRLADDDVAQLMEALLGVAYRAGALRLRSSPREPALRKARVCYDHLAGDLGVLAFDAFRKRRWIAHDETGLTLSRSGAEFCRGLGIDVDGARRSRRPMCRVCLDWSARRHHLAGQVGAQLLERCYGLGWAKRRRGTRIVDFTPRGEREFLRLFEG